jgi:benzoyl-CoA reductase/2-hydroxyglutaryl-CoA dehydratase subunit BcrC/BadD/HgdB
MVEQSGGQIVFDATETGERTLPAAFDRRTIHEDPLAALTDAYFGSIPDPFRRPNNEFYKWLGLKIQERGVRGIILHRYLWCDIWHAEAQRIKEWLGLPFLQLDVTDAGFETARTLSRLQAFLEVLR